MSHRFSRTHLFCGRLLFSLAIFIHLAGSVAATFQADPEYLIDTWETEEGLPENSATAMVQTPDGYLWFGTFNGLVRFDGVKFTVLDPANTPQLPGGGIINLHLDQREWLWVSTDRGLVLRQSDTGRWRAFGTNEGWAGDYVRSFAERPNGDLLLTTFDGHVLEFASDRLRELPAPGGRSGEGYLAQVDELNRWRVVQRWFVGSWDGQQWMPNPAATGLLGHIAGSGAGSDRGCWLMVDRELLKLSQTNRTVHFELPDGIGNPWSITEDSRSNLWFATYDHGLSCISPTGEFRQWTMTNGLSYASTRFVFEDREKNLWVGTSGGGLQRFKLRRFRSFGPEQSLPERVVRSVAAAPDGSMWIATYGKGLCRFRGNAIEPVPPPGPDLFFSYTQSLLTDHAGRMWVGTFGQSAWMADTNGFHLIGADHTGGHNVFALFEDSRGCVWIASAARIAVSEGDSVRLLPARAEFTGVRCFAEDAERVIWVAGPQGVFRVENDCPVEMGQGAAALRQIYCLKAEPEGFMWLGSLRAGLYCWRNGTLATIGPEAGLPVSAVFSILQDPEGFFWLTSNRGIARVPRSDLIAVIEGKACRVRGELFDKADGLPSVECPSGQQPTCACDSAGRMWFPTLKGLAMVDPAGLQLNRVVPPVHIESVVYRAPARPGREGSITSSREAPEVRARNNMDQREGSVVALVQDPSDVPLVVSSPFPKSLRLPAGSRRIEIHYTAPSFVAPEKVRFQVKLEGRDTDWQDAGNKRVANFYELRPREYVLRVRAANNDGVWNETGASVAFAVEPFFWQTPWFRLGFLFCLFGAGGATAGWRLRARHRRELGELQRSRRQEAELAHVARVSTMGELASSVAHELNQPLGAILSNAEAAELFLNQAPPAVDEVREILVDIRKDDERAGEVIQRMRTLLRKREMEMAPLELASVLDEVFRLVNADASLRGTTITAELAPQLPLIQGDRIHLQQVVLNLILNAMEAMTGLPPQKRRLTVRTGLNGANSVELTVTDSGCGIDPANLPRLFEPFYTTKPNGMGMGLSIARRIIEAHQGRIWAENNATGGATFRVVLPGRGKEGNQ